MLLGTLGSSLFRSLLTGKRTIPAGKGVMRQVKAKLELVKIFNAVLSFNKF